MDLTASIEARSDQINADDLIGGPATFTIREVVKGKAEQPFDFLLEGTDKAFRPGVTMRRVVVNAWGAESSAYVGRSLTLYRDPSVRFGNAAVGGIRISHMTDIPKRLEVLLQVKRGKRETYAVDPLSRIDALRAEYKTATPDRQAAILAEVEATKTETDTQGEQQ